MQSEAFDVCMIGLGPVGAISGLCFAKQGFKVIGVDSNPERVAAFAQGRLPFVEPGAEALAAEMQARGRFTATTDFELAIKNSRIVMICVGTPTPENSGGPDFSFLDKVAESLGGTITKGAIIVLRSTVPPGTLSRRLGPVIERCSGLKAGVDFHLLSNPEFLREGAAIQDFFQAGRVVIGAQNETAAEAVAELYREVDADLLVTSVESAEFAKYVDNTWHALKVAFANEIGRTVLAFGGDVAETTRIFLADEKLNLSAKYLTPGFAFGGSCLPKDVRGLHWLAAQHGVRLPVVEAILPSNDEQIRQGVQAILATGAKKVGLLGIAFKAGVDDLRESPALYVAKQLADAGVALCAHDMHLTPGTRASLPGGGEILVCSLEEVIRQADLLVRFQNIPAYEGYKILDMTQVVQSTC